MSFCIIFCRDEVERLAKECKMRLYRTSVKEDLNVSGVFQHLAENYVNKVKSFTEHNEVSGNNPPPLFQIGASSRATYSNSYMTTTTNNNSKGPLYITKPVNTHRLTNGHNNTSSTTTGYVPSLYSNHPQQRPQPRVMNSLNR